MPARTKNIRRILPFIFILLAFLFLIDAYVFTGVRAVSSVLSPYPEGVTALVYWSFSIAFLLLSLYIVAGTAQSGSGSLKVVGSLGALLYIPKLVFSLFLGAEDVYRLLRSIAVGIYKLTGSASANMIPYYLARNPVFSSVAGISAILVFLGVLFGITKGKHHFKVHKTELEFDDLPEGFDGFTITQLSDIHAGSFDNVEKIKEAVGLINEQKSDVIFFTGDLVNNKAEEMEPWVSVFSKLEAPMGKYSVLGNHDYGDYATWPSPEAKRANLLDLFKIHERIGFRLIKNGNLKLERKGERIELLGMENWGQGFSQYGDFEKTLSGTNTDAFRILLSHDPSHWEGEVREHEQHIHLTLAGHTHGMQFGFELFGFKFSPVSLRYRKWAGLYKENNRYLYVNRGFGFIGFPGRVGIWPEITVITLRKKKPAGK